jgi:hypothetical protein
MAYDRYDTRRDPRERWRADERFDRERGYRGRDERGFFERAGDEIASWFGDEDAERRRRMENRDGGEFRRDRDRDVTTRMAGRDRWDRDDNRSLWRDEDSGMFGASSYRGYSGDFSGRGGDNFSDRDYKPMTGDYGRGEFERPRSRFGSDDGRRTMFGGARERSHDPHYAEWRNRQIDELDRDYDDYRRENQSKFESDFGNWRTTRQGKRQLLGSVREHMEVVGSDEEHVGTVDRVAGDRIILTKSDVEAGGSHHSLPCSLIDRIENDRVILDSSAEQAKQKWRDDSRERALFEREDQGEAGPGILDRSFSGTYR